MTCHVRQVYLLIFPLLMPPLINHIPQHNQQLSKNISITWMCWKLQQCWVTLPKHHNPKVQCDSFKEKIKWPLWAPSAPCVAVRAVTGLIWNSEGKDERGMFRDLWHGWNGAGTDPWQHPPPLWRCGAPQATAFPMPTQHPAVRAGVSPAVLPPSPQPPPSQPSSCTPWEGSPEPLSSSSSISAGRQPGVCNGAR